MSWTDTPNFDEVHDILKRRASLSGRIRITELNIQLLEAEIGLEKPRNTHIRFLGSDGNRERMQSLRVELVNLRNELDEVEAEIKFLDYRKDIFRAVAYRERA